MINLSNYILILGDYQPPTSREKNIKEFDGHLRCDLNTACPA